MRILVPVARVGASAIVIWLLAGGAARPQTVTATLVGTVLDPTGAAIPNAAVTATNMATNLSRTAPSNERGDYTITYLPPGSYQVSAECAGFKRTVAGPVPLLVEQTARLDLVLEVGWISESIEVKASAVLVNSETSAVGQVIDQSQMQSLPLKGRGFYELALLAPGVTPRMPGSFVGNRRPMPGGLNAPAFYVAGARENANGYLIDGVDANDPHYLTPSAFPSVDAIQEFKLQTNAYSAEFGRFAAQVNATTRSGTNEYRGSAYHYFRNDALDAANFFSNATGAGKAPLRYNQSGGTFGGPVLVPKLYHGRNRSFFFVSYEATRIRNGRTAQLNVPTPEQRAGDFNPTGFRGNQPVFDPATTRANPGGPGFVRAAFPGNSVPAARITPFAKTVLGLYPAPTLDIPRGNNFFATLSDDSDNDQILTRFDHRFNAGNSVFFRYSWFDGVDTNLSPIDQGGSSTAVRTQNLSFNYVRIFTPSTLNELRLGYNRPVYLILQDGAYKQDYARILGIRNLLSDPIGWGVPQVGLTGYTGIGTATNPTTQVSNVYQIVDHVSAVRGGHSIKAGGEARKTNYNDRSESYVRGNFSFTGAMSADPQRRSGTGNAIADLLLGLPLSANGSSTSLAGNFDGFSYSFFFQDDWKASSRLTLNLGVRYELNTRYRDVQNRLTFFDPLYPGGRLLLSGTSQAYIPGQGIVQGPATPRGLLPADTNNWAPRIGLAFRPFRDARTALRAGYGIFYSMIELQELRTWVRNPPFGEVVALSSNQNGNSAGDGVLRVSELFPAKGSPASRPSAYSPTADFPEPYYQQWNFTIQREIPWNTLVEAGYIGSKGTRLILRNNFNQARLDPDPSRPTNILTRRPYPLFGNTLRIGMPEGNSTYHGMILKLERRFANGFSFLASYTWSKSLDDASLIDNQPRDIYNRSLSKGRSQFDVRRRAVVSGVWELPFGRGKAFLAAPGFAGALLGGWQVNAIAGFTAGFPFTVAAQGDACNCGAAGQTAEQTGDPLTGFTRSRMKWFNTAAFVNPRSGTFGSSGRNILEGPGNATVDASLFRAIRLAERAHLQLRGEFFNAFNRVNFGQPGAQVNSNSFGIIQGAGAARVIQLAARFRF